MTAPMTEREALKMVRDEIAMIIDPDAFEDAMLQDDLTPSERLYLSDARQTNKAAALRKADTILAMLGNAQLPLRLALEQIIEIDTMISDGGKVHDHGPCASLAIYALRDSGATARVPMREALEAAKAAMLRTRTASIAGCEEGYGKPELWGEELFASHGDLTKAIKLCDAALADPQPQEGEHIYSPDYQAMGDCRVCGHEQDSVRHIGTPKHASLTRPYSCPEDK